MNRAAVIGMAVVVLGLVIFGAYGIHRSEQREVTNAAVDETTADAWYARHQPCATPSYDPDQCADVAHTIRSSVKDCWVCAPNEPPKHLAALNEEIVWSGGENVTDEGESPGLEFYIPSPTGAYGVEWPLDGNHVVWVADTGWTSESTIAFIAGGVELMRCTYYDPTHDTNEPSDENCTIEFERFDRRRTTAFRGNRLAMVCRLTEDEEPSVSFKVHDPDNFCFYHDHEVESRVYVGLEEYGPICAEAVEELNGPLVLEDANAKAE